MNKKQLIGIFICAFVTALSGVYAQNNLTIHYIGGNNQTVNLNKIGKITFLDGKMDLDGKESGVTSYVLSEIANITFEATKTPASGIEEGVTTKELSIYPNPAMDAVRLRGLEEASMVTVYTVAGNVVMHLEVFPDESIHVAGLPKGLYLLRVNNRTIKFSKL